MLHIGRDDLTKNCAVQVALYKEGKALWKQHPSYNTNSCDVILLPLDTTTLIGNNYDLFLSAFVTFIGSEIINNRLVNPFGNVTIIGYPQGFHDELNNLPIYRKASIASAYGVYFEGFPYFLVDAHLHPGTSGSPVVNSHHTLFKESEEEGYTLFGIHSGTYSIAGDSLGLNIVWYAHTLLEIAEG